ncbi:TelA-like protein [Brevundimonas phage vB_BpoS-Kikimora]|uniref:TelA-like protein n=1 Tax=Brevundimonas phage vB_BpoS-Kikimora TaxID=2948601 RepID=A0A9E7MS09_9CAUD|nr:TelA-like protein [Brevundimonas phage vB_BpoS-Kikimora]
MSSSPMFAKTETAQATPAPSVSAGALRPFTMTEIVEYGRSHSVAASSVSAKINSSARSGDIDEVGKALTALLTGAEKYDVKSLKGGSLFGLFKRTKRQLEAHYKTIDQQMNVLADDVEKQVQHFKMRVGDLQGLRAENRDRHAALGDAIVNASARIEWMEQNPPQVDPNDPMSASELQAWNNTITYARKRVDDLGRDQTMCVMIDSMIDMMINNTSQLVLKFGEIKGTTLPQLQMGFSLYIANMESEKGADYATAITDKNNEIMRQNADRLGMATVKVAGAMSRSSIDLATLQHTKDTLFKTGDELKRIATETAQRLKAESPQIAQISQEVANRYIASAA